MKKIKIVLSGMLLFSSASGVLANTCPKASDIKLDAQEQQWEAPGGWVGALTYTNKPEFFVDAIADANTEGKLNLTHCLYKSINGNYIFMINPDYKTVDLNFNDGWKQQAKTTSFLCSASEYNGVSSCEFSVDEKNQL